MGFSARSLVALALVLAPSVAAAQGAPGTAAPAAPAGGGAGHEPAPATSGSGAPAVPEKKGEVGGFTFKDKQPAGRGPQTARRVVHKGGPLATFPGFEQLPDGGSRLFVQLSQTVPVEERRAQGSVTYVLKGAHLRVHNDSNALVTVHFNTPVFRARLTPSGNDLLFVLELRSASTPTFKVQDNQDKTSTLQIDFPKGDFVTDGSERLPSEERPEKGKKRSGKPPAPSPAQPKAPAEPESGGNGNPGPTP
jgi:hypothetical protein